jgi:hypothetical protein
MLTTTDQHTLKQFNEYQRQCRNSEKPGEQAFMRLISLWEAYSDEPTLVDLFAPKGQFRDGHQYEYDFVVYRPIYDEFGRLADRKFWFAGGWVNHGTVEEPDWCSHT